MSFEGGGGCFAWEILAPEISTFSLAEKAEADHGLARKFQDLIFMLLFTNFFCCGISIPSYRTFARLVMIGLLSTSAPLPGPPAYTTATRKIGSLLSHLRLVHHGDGVC